MNDTPRQYLNRLSDLMFVLARVLNRMNGGDDVYWKKRSWLQEPSAGRWLNRSPAHERWRGFTSSSPKSNPPSMRDFLLG